MELLCMTSSLTQLYLAKNEIRELPQQFNKLRQLKVLDLSGNKIQQLHVKGQCSIGSLENLEELYLNDNRLKDLPTVFQNYGKLKILGLDWFEYLGPPYTLPKILEDPLMIQTLKEGSIYHN